MKIVINAKFGGFGLSHKAVMRYAEIKEIKLHAWLDDIILKHNPEATLETAMVVHYATVPKEQYDKFSKQWHKADMKDRGDLGNGGYFSDRDIERTDLVLIQIVKELGKDVNGRCANLEVIEIPDDVDWEIQEYDGLEHVAEKHRTWN